MKEKKKDGIRNEELLARLTSIVSDPLGSYTGRPLMEGELPVQDADDL